MKTDSVLVELEDRAQNTVVGCSGLLLNEKYVIITANILFERLNKNDLNKIEPGKLCTDLSICNIFVNVVRKNQEMYVVKKAKVFGAFVSDKIKNSNKFIFQNWAIDTIDNNRNLNKVMSIFCVLSFQETASVEEFKENLKEWWELLITLDAQKGDTLYIRCTPFANRNFMNSVSKGIVSNILGNSSCLILSDCPCSPGCEGSPVYLCRSGLLDKDVPVGLVISSLSWWRGEFIGLTLVADIRSIILELIEIPINVFNITLTTESPKVIATIESCLAQIYSGRSWGTATLLDQDKGIFITNSHVVQNRKLTLFHRGKSCDAQLVHKTPDGEVFDLAIVKCDPGVVKNVFKLRSIPISRRKYKLGDTVYSAGYALFPRECNPSPSLCKGCISQTNSSMMKTTCSVHPGSSGGAILDREGDLLGIIVCNARLENNNMVYPRINMAIPFSAISETLLSFIERDDSSILHELHVKNKEAEFIWKRIEGKL